MCAFYSCRRGDSCRDGLCRKNGRSHGIISPVVLLLASCCLSLVAEPFPTAAQEKEPPVTMKQSVEFLLKNSNALKAIQENRMAAGYEVDRAKAGYGPSIDMTVRGGYGKLTDSTTRSYGYNEASPYSSGSLVLSQPIWDGWETRSRVREAESIYRSLDHRVLDNANSLALDAIIAHVDVLRRQEILRLAEDNVQRHEVMLGKASARASQGVDTVADVSQAQSRLARAQSTLAEAEANLRVAEDTYVRLTKHPARNLAPVAMPASVFSSAEEVLEAARKGNPKVAAYLEDVNAATAAREQVKAAYNPSLSLEAGPSFSDRDGKSELWTAEVGVAAVIRWNLFNSGADVAESRAAAARIRQSRRVLYNYMDELKLNVEQNWTRFVSAKKQLAFYQEAIGYNELTCQAYEDQFIMGQRSLLDVLDAENELFNSSSQVATTHGNTIIAVYRMKALAGELIRDLGIDTALLADLPEDTKAHDYPYLPKAE